MNRLFTVAISAAVLLTWPASGQAENQFVQQGPKLVGTGIGYGLGQGWAVGLSSDGNTALVAGKGQILTYTQPMGWNNGVWFFTRQNGTWHQQKVMLLGAGALAGTDLWSAALSGDAKTAIVGWGDANNSNGAVWILTRNGSDWFQKPLKLVEQDYGTGQGVSVAISGDGNTAIIGGSRYNSGGGAAWIYSRHEGDIWTGLRLPSGAPVIGNGGKAGWSVAISSNGNYAIVGAPYDDNGRGAAWVYKRDGNVWKQFDQKLVPGAGESAYRNLEQGTGVAIAAIGDKVVAVVGAAGPLSGAVPPGIHQTWVFTGDGKNWAEEALSGEFLGKAGQEYSVAIAADGKTIVAGSPVAGQDVGVTRAWGAVGYASNIAQYVKCASDPSQCLYSWAPLNDSNGSNTMVGGGYASQSHQGRSVAVSADGTTAIVGGWGDHANKANIGFPGNPMWIHNTTGAAWVWTRNLAVQGQTGSSPAVGTGPYGGTRIPFGCQPDKGADSNHCLTKDQAGTGNNPSMPK